MNRHAIGQYTFKVVHGVINQIEVLTKSGGGLTGLITGFPDLDHVTGGLRGGELIVIGSRPSVGKTTLSANIAEYVAVDQRLPIGVITLEMGADAYASRMLYSRARVNRRTVEHGLVTERDFDKLTTATSNLSKSSIHILGTAGISTGELRDKAKQLHSEFGVRLLIVDYVQLLKAASDEPVENREQEVTTVAHALKALAMELQIPVVALSQLNRDLDRADTRRMPRISDLRESGAIEDAADIVMLLYRAESDQDDYGETAAVPINVFIAKHRSGPIGVVPLAFFREFPRFEPIKPPEPERPPESDTDSLSGLNRAWKASVSPECAAHSNVTGLNKGTLFVQMDDQQWLDAAVRSRKQILEALKKQLGNHASIIDKISFRLRA